MRTIFAWASVAALGVGGCIPSTTPGEQLWPTADVPEIDLWQPIEQVSTNYDAFADQIRVEQGSVDGRYAVFIENLDQTRPITVYYQDTAGDYQAIPVAPGGSTPAATTPQTILGID